MRSLLKVVCAVAALIATPVAAADIGFWDNPRHGSNCFNESPPDEAYFRALKATGATWVRLTFSKWKAKAATS